MSFIRKIFSGISSAVKWLTQEDPRLREVKDRSLVKSDETDTTDKAEKNVREYPDPWEELDNIRSSMWLGRWGRQYTKRGIDKLKKDLKGDVEAELEKGKDKKE